MDSERMVSGDSSGQATGQATRADHVDDVERVKVLAAARTAIVAELGKRIVGQSAVVDQLLVTLFAGGHGLFVGVPGLAKTLLVNSLAEVLSLDFRRIQFTPDLMPSDITGTDVLEADAQSGTRHFRFVRGPVFTNILLADEINRTPPKTQAALLQAMEEGRVTAGGTTYPLSPPYHVFATQNPIEHEGTYPLPEAQLDRFMLQIDVGYPSADEEREIVTRTSGAVQQPLRSVLSRDEITDLQQLVRRVPVAPHVVDYAVGLVRRSRPTEATAPELVKRLISFGAGPRASQALVLAAKARAVLAGRYAAELEDVRALAHPVLRHRLVASFRAESEGVRADHVIDQLLDTAQA